MCTLFLGYRADVLKKILLFQVYFNIMGAMFLVHRTGVLLQVHLFPNVWLRGEGGNCESNYDACNHSCAQSAVTTVSYSQGTFRSTEIEVFGG